jgi:hypothetical protein
MLERYRSSHPRPAFARFTSNAEEAELAYWAWVLLFAGLSGLAVASIYVIVDHTHRRVPARQVPQGDPEADISA